MMERLMIIPGVVWTITTSVGVIVSPPRTEETLTQKAERTFRLRLTEKEQNLLDDLLITMIKIKGESGVDVLVLLVGSFARSLHGKNFDFRQPKDIDLYVVSSAEPGSKVQEEIARRLEEGIISLLEEQKIPLERGHCFDGSIDLYFRTQKQPDLRPFDITVNRFNGPDIEGHLANERETGKPYFVLLDTRDGQDK